MLHPGVQTLITLSISYSTGNQLFLEVKNPHAWGRDKEWAREEGCQVASDPSFVVSLEKGIISSAEILG